MEKERKRESKDGREGVALGIGLQAKMMLQMPLTAIALAQWGKTAETAS